MEKYEDKYLSTWVLCKRLRQCQPQVNYLTPHCDMMQYFWCLHVAPSWLNFSLTRISLHSPSRNWVYLSNLLLVDDSLPHFLSECDLSHGFCELSSISSLFGPLLPQDRDLPDDQVTPLAPGESPLLRALLRHSVTWKRNGWLDSQISCSSEYEVKICPYRHKHRTS